MKKIFLVFLVLLAGMAGLSAAPPRPGGAVDPPQAVILQVDITASLVDPGIPVPMRPGGVFATVQGDDVAFTEAIELICSWFDQYREGLLTETDFKTLVTGRIGVMYMRGQAIKGIRRIGSLALAGFPLLC